MTDLDKALPTGMGNVAKRTGKSLPELTAIVRGSLGYLQRALTSSSQRRAINSCPCGSGCTPSQIHCSAPTALAAVSNTSCVGTRTASNSRANFVITVRI